MSSELKGCTAHGKLYDNIGNSIARDPSIHIMPALGPKVWKYYLHWAIWIPRVLEMAVIFNYGSNIKKSGKSS